MDIYLVRHGQSLGNIGATDEPDPDLTELGWKQAAAVGERLSSYRFDCICVSTLLRAVETASEIVRQQHSENVRVEYLPALMEVGTPAGYPGCSTEKILTYIPLAMPVNSPDLPQTMPSEPSLSDVHLRMKAVVQYLFRNFSSDDSILLVTHGGFMEQFLRVLLEIPPECAINFSHVNAGLTRVCCTADANGKYSFRVRFLNDTRHLPYSFLNNFGLDDMYAISNLRD